MADINNEDSDVLMYKTHEEIITLLNQKLDALYAKGHFLTTTFVPSSELWASIQLVDTFQEYPQLIDPHLSRYMDLLTSQFLTEISQPDYSPYEKAPKEYEGGHMLLIEATARLIYTFCKVRGWKVITRFLPNDAQWLEPMVKLLEDAKKVEYKASWQLSSTLLLWLAHLSLTPFDLATISSEGTAVAETEVGFPRRELRGRIPVVAARMLALGAEYVPAASVRESDVAALLLARTALRRDMRALGVLDGLVEWCLEPWKEGTQDEIIGQALQVRSGSLKILGNVLSLGDRVSVRRYLPRIFRAVCTVEDNWNEDPTTSVWESAIIRRLGMKIYRWIGILSLPPPGGVSIEEMEDELSSEEETEMVEEIIGRFLTSLGDKDTSVRMSASKSLALLTTRLNSGMASEVIEAILDGFSEDVLQDERGKDVYWAVSPEKWHGLTLTLAALLRQRAVFAADREDLGRLLTKVFECVLKAVGFEIRKLSFAAGSNVRDAANYAIWSLARNYSTKELDEADTSALDLSWCGEAADNISATQLLAVVLVVTACLDTVGNIRRGASAALQELVGRHPDIITEGISLVQRVDYMAVALRRRSTLDVSPQAAALHQIYWNGIARGLVEDWRGVGAVDPEARKLAATALNQLVLASLPEDTDNSRWERGLYILNLLFERYDIDHKSEEIRHGLFFSLASVLDALRSLPNATALPLEYQARFHKIFSPFKGPEFTHIPLRPELTCESSSRLINSLLHSLNTLLPFSTAPSNTFHTYTTILDLTLIRKEDNTLAEASAATQALFSLLPPSSRASILTTWARRIRASTARGARGYITALGSIALAISKIPHTPQEEQLVVDLMTSSCTTGEIESRVAAVKGLGTGILGLLGTDLASKRKILPALLASLDDYSVDSRGDVGSWVRIEAVAAVLSGYERGFFDDLGVEEVINRLVRLSCEKMDKIRISAISALKRVSSGTLQLPEIIQETTPDIAFVNTSTYYLSLLSLLSTTPSLAEPLLQGYITSAGASSDTLLRTSLGALIDHLTSSPSTTPTIYLALTSILRSSLASTTERLILPTLEVLATISELGLFNTLEQVESIKLTSLLRLTQKAVFKSTSIAKLVCAVRVYTSLAMIDTTSEEAKTRLVRLLPHNYARVREAAAEGLVLVLGGGEVQVEDATVGVLMETDWEGRKGWAEAVRGVERGLGIKVGK